MATIQRFKEWSRVEGNMFAIVFQHADPGRAYFNLESTVHPDFNLDHTYDGITQYISDKHWHDFCEVVKLAAQEADAFYAEVNAAIEEDGMKEPDGSENLPDGSYAMPDIDAMF